MEGVSQEAIAIAGHLKLAKLIVLYDDNGISIDGKTSLSDSVDQLMRFRSAGWRSLRIDGHDPQAILKALKAARRADKPTLIACRTTIGFGLPTKAGTSKAHGEAPGAAEIAGARAALNWPYEPFVVPDEILAAWRAAGARGKGKRARWRRTLAALPAEAARRVRATRPRRRAGRPRRGGRRLQAPARRRRSGHGDPQVGEAALKMLAPAVPELITGSADLTGPTTPRCRRPSRSPRRHVRPLRSLGHPRARHGGGLQRHGVARRFHSVGLELPGVHRLCASVAALAR